MSLISGAIGDKSQFPDGIIVNHVSEQSVGHGVRNQPITDPTTYPVLAGEIGESFDALGSSVATNTSGYTNIASLTLTVGVWLVSATSMVENSGSQTGAIHRLMVKGIDGGSVGKDQLTTNSSTAGIAYTAAFAARVINVASGDSDKTIKVRQQSISAAGTAFSYISAVRIA